MSSSENGVNGSASKESGGQTKADAQLRRGRWTTALETFSPIWFALVMNTGILSIILHNLPYQFRGIDVLSTILFVFALVQFVLYFCLHLLRIVIFPRSFLQQTLNNPEELCLWGCFPIAFLTLTAQVAITVSGAGWGGHAFTLVAYVMWWIATFCMVTASVVIYVTLMELKAAGKEMKMPTAVFIPAVGTTTDAVVGALVCSYSADISARLAVPIIVTGWLLVGYGFFIAMSIYSLFFHILFQHGYYLPAAKWPSYLLFVGPAGQSGAAIQLLATAAASKFAGYHKGIFLQAMSTSSIRAYSTVFGLLFTGFDLFWLFIGLYAILKGAFTRKIPFTMTWWSTIFPVATLDVSFYALSLSMDSPTFRVLTTGLFLILLIDWFLCYLFTFIHILQGKILDGREELAELAKKQD